MSFIKLFKKEVKIILMSKVIKVISLKSTKEVIAYGVPRIRFSEYANTLSEKAKNHPGFISTNSYWKNRMEIPENDEISKLEIVSISNWKSIDDWNDWLDSETRKKIKSSYTDIIGSESFNILNKRSPTDDTFLL